MRTERTGRDSEVREVHPPACANGHPWRVGKPGTFTVGQDSHPDGGRRRTWTCTTCSAMTWAD